MRDPRIDQVADILVNYSACLQPGEIVAIMGPPAAGPLLLELHRHALRAGAHPQVLCQLPETAEMLLREGNDDQILHVSPLADLVVNTFDCRMVIMAEENTKAMTTIDPARQVLRARAMQPIAERNMARLGDTADPYRWVTTLFPTHAYAQDAEMSLSEYADFVFSACLPRVEQLPQDARAFLDPDADPNDPVAFWQAFSRWQGQLASYLNGKQELCVVGPNIDLRLGIAGRQWWNADGHVNFPDGEVFTGPLEDSVEGWVAFTYPAVHRGQEVRDVRLRFEKGRVVEAEASHGLRFLNDMLDTDEGARRLGEFAIGTNPNVQRFTKHTLFDEKIKGTCHMAIGASVPGTGGMNRSAIHWDMVCDLRQDSRIYADGDLLYENGDFVIDFVNQAREGTREFGESSMARMFQRSRLHR